MTSRRRQKSPAQVLAERFTAPGPGDFLPGATVRCEYRGDHTGVVLADDDPRAWAGTLIFPSESPDPSAVRAHVAKLRAEKFFSREVKRPVLWSFGRVYWDSKLTPTACGRPELIEGDEQEPDDPEETYTSEGQR
jgi:hypothetical protein